MDNKKNIAEVFESYIRSGIKTKKEKSLGIEVEHFVLEKDSLKSVPYSGVGGVKEIIQKLMSFYADAVPIMGEDILGFNTKDFNITLEPAAQIEISVAQSDDIKHIGGIYKGFYKNLSDILEPSSLRFLFLKIQFLLFCLTVQSEFVLKDLL